ncbi:hypothetical protein E2C01_086292 [Portunus trituberculatus]|uniref:Uncharacterized protein n=1 Tax=Portunus trituberculatus TaxID=210409 RepID=A0A5B7JE71_PORTR|nr:hypothetical protein [Portunus trituberculatus]
MAGRPRWPSSGCGASRGGAPGEGEEGVLLSAASGCGSARGTLAARGASGLWGRLWAGSWHSRRGSAGFRRLRAAARVPGESGAAPTGDSTGLAGGLGRGGTAGLGGLAASGEARAAYS